MKLEVHRDFSLQKFLIGKEKAPLVVIDNLVSNPDQLISAAAKQTYTSGGRFYPGIRATAPSEYQRFVAQTLGPVLLDSFDLNGSRIGFSMCHYSIVTTPPEELELWQRMPHVDAVKEGGLASIHYLFKQGFGGTAFYRHRKTGFESINEARQQQYFAALEAERSNPTFPGAGYISGDNEFFEQVGAQEGVFNRMLIYRRNSLHSGAIDPSFIPDPNPLTGRLSINSFIDVV